jgi:small subunit ribosomal protein S6
MTIVSPDVQEDELPATIDRIGGYITASGGMISQTLRESPWGRRRLAYAIRHSGRDVRDGFYTVYHFEAPPSSIAEIERELRITDQVMRFLVTHYIPQPIPERPAEDGQAEPELESAEAQGGQAEPEVEEAEAPVGQEERGVEAQEELPAAETARAETPAAESAAEAVVGSAEGEAPVVEIAAEAVEVAASEAAPESESEPAPAKKPATRRKKAATAEQADTTSEPAEE